MLTPNLLPRTPGVVWFRGECGRKGLSPMGRTEFIEVRGSDPGTFMEVEEGTE